jgi:uncharacterized protein (DUF983 family)
MKSDQQSATLSAIVSIVGAIVVLLLLRSALSFILDHWVSVSVIVAVLVLAALGLFVRESAKG